MPMHGLITTTRTEAGARQKGEGSVMGEESSHSNGLCLGSKGVCRELKVEGGVDKGKAVVMKE